MISLRPNLLAGPLGLCTALLIAGGVSAHQGPGVKPHAGMMRYPAISARQIAFVYVGKLWLVPREGGKAVPLATPPGQVMLPKFSPDGSTVAFTGNYDGNPDLYTIPAEGGMPTRATHHPDRELLCGWTPDGKLLFSSRMMAPPVGAVRQLFTVSVRGGLPVRLPVPYGQDAAISPDGRYLAYTPSSTNFRTWKRYRGGWAQDIWLFDLQKRSAKRITDWEGTDTLPMWQGSTIYYLSDGGPEHRLNLWRYETKTGQRRQVTRFADYDVKWPSIGPGPKGGGEIVFEHGSELDRIDLTDGKIHPVEVRIPWDQSSLRPRMVDVSHSIVSAGISPTGKRAVVEARGDLWTAPAKNGTPRNLTHSSGAAERSPAWSPDGRWIAYFSDASGEYELTLTQSDGKGETRQLTLGGKAFRYTPIWSPDSKQIAFADSTGAISLCTVAAGQTRVIDMDPYANQRSLYWSPDSRFLAYAKSGESRNGNGALWIYAVETGQARQVTSGMFNDDNPVFDHKGDYLYFASNRAYQAPRYGDDGQTWVYNNTTVLLAVPLRADLRSPYLPTSDEESFAAETKPTPAPGKGDKPKIALLAQKPVELEAAPFAEDAVSGEWKGIAGDVSFTLQLTVSADGKVTGTVQSDHGAGTVDGSYDAGTQTLNLTLTVGKVTATLTGKIAGATLTGTATLQGRTIPLQAQRTQGAGAPASSSKPGETAKPASSTKPVRVTIDFDHFEERAILLPVKAGQFGQLAVNDHNQLIYARQGDADAGIKLFDLADEAKQEKTVAAGASNFDITPDGKKLLIVRGNSASIQDAASGASGDTVVTSSMVTQIDPRQEWRQIFQDAWRIERDFFYDPNMHHLDWPKVRDQYAKMLSDCATRDDVGYVISEMISELNVGHAYYGGGDIEPEPVTSVGMLGADFALENGAYRLAKIYQGAAWDVDARGPLSQPGLRVKEGDYVLAVNGTPLDTTQDPWAAFIGLANQVVTLTVSERPKLDTSAREVPVRLADGEANLRYRAWIERNRAYVTKQTGGRVGYLYVPNTGTDGQNDLVRQFMGQYGKEALIIDERWNGGGQVPDRFIELLNRPVTNYFARRAGKDWAWPPISHQGPKCMLINGQAGSGGDAFPWYFRQAGLGKLIGTRTWGGLVGIAGNPSLIDGGVVTAPNFAFYKKNGTWGIEGHGVDPDIEVLDDPNLMLNGGDPQLDAGIKEMLTEMKLHPYTSPLRPAYPDKRGMGIDPKDK